MSSETVLDALAGALMITGAMLALAAAIGIIRFPDVITRMHAATKPQVLGMLLVLGGAGIRLRDSVDLWMLVLTGGFQLLTAPVTAHLIGRLTYKTRHVRRDLLYVDELAAARRQDPPRQQS